VGRHQPAACQVVDAAGRDGRRAGRRRGGALAERAAYDAVRATVSQGDLFRTEAVVAVGAALLVLSWPRRSSWLAALLVAASALGAVLLYRYVDVGSLGPLPDMYENTWQVAGKLLSAYAEGAADLLAGLGLLTHRSAAPLRVVAGSQAPGGEVRSGPRLPTR
jgi:hypothetical protein